MPPPAPCPPHTPFPQPSPGRSVLSQDDSWLPRDRDGATVPPWARAGAASSTPILCLNLPVCTDRGRDINSSPTGAERGVRTPCVGTSKPFNPQYLLTQVGTCMSTGFHEEGPIGLLGGGRGAGAPAPWMSGLQCLPTLSWGTQPPAQAPGQGWAGVQGPELGHRDSAACSEEAVPCADLTHPCLPPEQQESGARSSGLILDQRHSRLIKKNKQRKRRQGGLDPLLISHGGEQGSLNSCWLAGVSMAPGRGASATGEQSPTCGPSTTGLAPLGCVWDLWEPAQLCMARS